MQLYLLYWIGINGIKHDRRIITMPRVCNIPVEVAVTVVKQFINFLSTDELPRWSDQIWKLMSTALKDLGYK